jgi:4-hydroxybenzoate polyprenyltransferase
MASISVNTAFKMIGPLILLAFASGLQICGALLFFKKPIDLILVLTYASITFCIYFINKFTDEEDKYNCPEQKIYFQQKSILITIPIALIISSIVLLASTGRLVAWHLVLVSGGILYSVNLIPMYINGSIRFIRIKDVFFIKNIFVSFLWAVSPFILAKGLNLFTSPTINYSAVLLASFITAFINTTSSDVRDIEGDRFSGIITIANTLGKRNTALLLFTIMSISCLFVAIFYRIGNISRPVFAFFLSIVFCAAIVAVPIYIDKLKYQKKLTEPLNDSQAILNGIALVVLSFNI